MPEGYLLYGLNGKWRLWTLSGFTIHEASTVSNASKLQMKMPTACRKISTWKLHNLHRQVIKIVLREHCMILTRIWKAGTSPDDLTAGDESLVLPDVFNSCSPIPGVQEL